MSNGLPKAHPLLHLHTPLFPFTKLIFNRGGTPLGMSATEIGFGNKTTTLLELIPRPLSSRSQLSGFAGINPTVEEPAAQAAVPAPVPQNGGNKTRWGFPLAFPLKPLTPPPKKKRKRQERGYHQKMTTLTSHTLGGLSKT